MRRRTHCVSFTEAIETGDGRRFVFVAMGRRSAMVGELIMLPLRVGVRATQLWLRAAEETANVAVNAAGRLIGLAASRGSDGRSSGAWTAPASEPNEADEVDSRDQDSPELSVLQREAPSPMRSPAPASPPVSSPVTREAVDQPEPAHVSEEPELVEEFAEPGVEDGAGPEIHVEEPWEGYGRMNAKQVIARLNSATPAALAAVQLYENRHRRRQTILNAVQRELRSANGSGSRSQ
jgi:hypothetical protein